MKCPSCGKNTDFYYCVWCGKCKKCAKTWHGSLGFKTSVETGIYPATYYTPSFCSDYCNTQFWNKVLSFPAEPYMGTDPQNFTKKWIQYWNDSIMAALSSNPNNSELIECAQRAKRNNTEMYPAFSWWTSSQPLIEPAKQSSLKAKKVLLENLLKCGRIEDAARIYEELGSYEVAKKLRERDKQIIVKKTDLSINLNDLLKQIRENGLVALYRCPHCGGKLKIGQNTSLETLNKCEHCDTEIQTMELAEFLKDILS